MRVRLMLTCRQTAELLSREQERPLPWHRRLAVRVHLLMCAACRRYARQLRWLAGAAHRAIRGAEAARLDARARDRILRAITKNRGP